jgi:ATP-dependent DNA helicase RecG
LPTEKTTEKTTEVGYLKGVGPKRADAFKKLGITRVEQLLTTYPRDYVYNIKIKDMKKYLDKNVLICGEVIDKQIPRKKHHPLKVYITDYTASASCVIWGDAFYRERQFRIKDKFMFWGKVSINPYDGREQFDYRDHRKLDETDEEFLKYPLIPLYILPGELKKTWIKPLLLTKIIFNAIKKSSPSIGEILTEQILNENNLLPHKQALLRTHYPLSEADIESARQTLAFEELFFLQLIVALRKKAIQGDENGIVFEKAGEKVEKLLKEHLGFELTDAQKRVIKEIRADMKSPKPMNRLLQGDVGSGKTIVAVFCMLIAIENGYQCAFMCPTEILAEQHHKVLKEYFDKLGVNIALLVGGQKKRLREQILQDIRLGKADVVVGTHALIQEGVEFKPAPGGLGFIVIDEQHKFGVMQKAKLREKSTETGLNPDVMVMTATPIPRTLSLTIYGDLDVSVINEMPKNRKPVKTALRFESDRLKVYNFVRDEVSKGRQAYIVYPIIDESEKLDLKAAVKHYEILKEQVFNDLRVGLVHGRMFWYEIDDTIEDFRNRKLDVLVSTTVIEVGIDIPNASIMIIEEAQRFGLSQLHQLRGRVGRGAEQSFCILMASDELTETASERLEILVETTDGFKISEKDLSLRGPGEFFGTRQSGELKFTAADLSKDFHLLEKARNSAFQLIEKDPHLRAPDNLNIRNHFLTYYRDSMSLIKVA